MKSTLVLGAGLVARPLVRYLLDHDIRVTVASRTVSKAQELIEDHPRGHALALDAKDDATLDRLVGEHDLTVSLLPYTLHVKVARVCLKHRRPLITTSYVSDAMAALDAEARQAGILILNEVGLDPGIDHMSAMKIIHAAAAAGGRVVSFRSFCGGLPAPEANDNPYGYKFSWSPKGVLMAGRNDARFLEDGREVHIPGKVLFDHARKMMVPIAGEFEGYPNRNSVPYKKLYGLSDAQTVLRGTLRHPGWCETLRKVSDLGLVSDEERSFAGQTYAGVMRELAKAGPGADARQATAAAIHLPADHPVLDRLAWLGLFSDEPVAIERGGTIDMMTALMVGKMSYADGERDMIVLNHEFEVAHPDRRERITSTLVDFGIPGGDSAMARTVSLPAAIAARMILEGQIRETGVHIPIVPGIYEPILAELESMGVKFVERTSRA